MTLPAVHGHTHKPGGSDPIGGYLKWGTNDDTDSLGLVLNAAGDVQINSTDDITLAADDDVLISGDLIRLTAGSGSGSDPGFTSENNLEILADGQLTLQGETTLVMLFPAGSLEVPDAAQVNLRIITGATFTVLNNSFQPIFRVDEDGDLHGKSGKALTFDL